MLLSLAVMFGLVSPRTMQLKGSLSGRALTILVDLGSSHSFLSSTIAADIPNLKQLPSPVTVHVADGGSIVYSTEIQCAEWSVQGYIGMD